METRLCRDGYPLAARISGVAPLRRAANALAWPCQKGAVQLKLPATSSSDPLVVLVASIRSVSECGSAQAARGLGYH
jgi:hypothetical protein